MIPACIGSRFKNVQQSKFAKVIQHYSKFIAIIFNDNSYFLL